MKFSRLINPEYSPVQETGRAARFGRTIGGYALGFMGYAAGVGALSNTLVTGGLSIPVLGGLSSAFFAGSRALLRPVYQDTDDYEPVKSESRGEKAARIASFVGGFAITNVGLNLLTAGLFNALEGISLGVPGRIGATLGGAITTVIGTNIVRGSFDPQLHTDTTKAPRTRALSGVKTSFIDGWNKVRQESRASKESTNRQIAQHRLLSEEFKVKTSALIKEFSEKLRSGEADRDGYRAELDALTTDYYTKLRALRTSQQAA